jgi:hypothetical protein
MHIKQDHKDTIRRIWGSLPLNERAIRNIRAEAAKVGCKVALSTISRWVAEWKSPPRTNSQAVQNHHVEVIEQGEPIAPPGLAEGMDQAINAVIDPRLSPMLRFEHIAKIEDYLVGMAESIHERRNEIAALVCDPEGESETTSRADGIETTKKVKRGQVGRDAVVAMVQIANGIKALMDTRATYSGSYRFIGEYEMMSGRGRKDRAEATAIDEGQRSERAKEISGSSEQHDDGADALAILRGMVTKPK